MDLNTTIDIIIKDLNEVREIIDDLKKYQGVPFLQIELAKSKCRSVAEVIALLKDFHGSLGIVREKELRKVDVTHEEKVIHIENHEIAVPKEKESGTAEFNITEVTQISEIDHISEVIPEIGNKPKQVVKKQGEPAIIADQFSDRSESFNETLASLKHEDDVSEILKTKPLTNLSEAIGINDKFLFIREIFNGDPESYNNAIIKLDSALSLNDAKSVITGYTGDITDSEAVRQLLDLLKRKFHQNE